MFSVQNLVQFKKFSVWEILEVKLNHFELFHFCVSLHSLTCRWNLFHDAVYSQVQSQ